MAILKKITLDNGIITNYHRVVSVNNITNITSIIEIASYTTQEKREQEKNAIENNQKMNVFVDSEYINIPYNPELNVNSAYDYLKQTEKYSRSKDV